MKEDKEKKYDYEDVLKILNNENKTSPDYIVFLFILFNILGSNKEDTLKGIEKQLDEIKWLLTDKK